MGKSQEPRRTRRAFMRAVLASLLFAALAQAPASAVAENAPATPAEGAPAGLASADGVLAKVKAEHPDATILKIELTRGEDSDLPEWIYEVKLFPPDGRILRLTYDAKTLALVETVGGGHKCRHGGVHGGVHHGGGHGGGPMRMRLRQGWRHDNEAGQ